MGKQLVFEYDGNEYTLEYTRKSIKEMERKGFVINNVVDKPMSTLPDLFAGAFIAHHRYVSDKTREEIFERMTNKRALIDKLAEMYQEPLNTLIEDNEDNSKNGIQWEPNF